LEKEAQAIGSQVYLSEEEISKLRKWQSVVNGSIHPDTGKPIPWLMRMSAFVPVNIPIIFGMLMARPSPFNIVFYQWLN